MFGCPPSNVGEIDQIPKQFQFANDVCYITQVGDVYQSLYPAPQTKFGGVQSA